MKPVRVYERIREILESARNTVARSVNTTQVVANWLIGREIVEEEQRGASMAGYGQKLIQDLSSRLQKNFGQGYGTTNLKLFRQFYWAYPNLIPAAIGHTLCDQSGNHVNQGLIVMPDGKSAIGHTACDQSWTSGQLHPNLAWSLYRHLLRVESPAEIGRAHV